MTRILEAELAVTAQCELAEGPVWDASRGLLWWVDILVGHVHTSTPRAGHAPGSTPATRWVRSG